MSRCDNPYTAGRCTVCDEPHRCVGLLPTEVCDSGEVWTPCEAEVCSDPCRNLGPCHCPCHTEDTP